MGVFQRFWYTLFVHTPTYDIDLLSYPIREETPSYSHKITSFYITVLSNVCSTEIILSRIRDVKVWCTDIQFSSWLQSAKCTESISDLSRQRVLPDTVEGSHHCWKESLGQSANQVVDCQAWITSWEQTKRKWFCVRWG